MWSMPLLWVNNFWNDNECMSCGYTAEPEEDTEESED